MSLKVWVEYIFMSLKMLTAVLKTAILSVWRDKSAHNAICDFYAHMARNRERRLTRCFRRYFGNIAQRYFHALLIRKLQTRLANTEFKKRSETMIQLDSIRGMLPSLAETLKEVGDSL